MVVTSISQGDHSSQDEQGSAALHARKLDDDLGGAPVQVSWRKHPHEIPWTYFTEECFAITMDIFT